MNQVQESQDKRHKVSGESGSEITGQMMQHIKRTRFRDHRTNETRYQVNQVQGLRDNQHRISSEPGSEIAGQVMRGIRRTRFRDPEASIGRSGSGIAG